MCQRNSVKIQYLPLVEEVGFRACQVFRSPECAQERAEAGRGGCPWKSAASGDTGL